MKEDLDNHEEYRSKKQKVDDREKTIRQAVNKMKQNLDQGLNPNYLKAVKEFGIPKSSLYVRVNKESNYKWRRREIN